MPKTGPFAFPARAFPEDDLPGGGDDVGEAEDAPDQDYYVFLNVRVHLLRAQRTTLPHSRPHPPLNMQTRHTR